MPAFDIPANLAFDTYDGLVSSINDWMDRSDLSGFAQQMIALSEARMRRELTPYFGEKNVAVAVTAGFAPLPTDYGTIRRVVMRGVPLNNIGAYTTECSPGVAQGYSVEQSSLRIWPAGDYAVTVLYQPELPQLSAANPATDLLQRQPDLYFYGALMFANGYVADDARAVLFKQLWDEAMDSAKQYFLRQKYPGPLVPRLRVP
jgi:hypothetical protein